MSYWDLLTEDLQDLIISIKNDTEKINIEKNTPKIGYFIYKKIEIFTNINEIYYFHITKINKKTFKSDYIKVNLNEPTFKVFTNIGPFKIKKILNGVVVNDYIKNNNLPYINIRDLIPENTDIFNKLRYGGLRYLL